MRSWRLFGRSRILARPRRDTRASERCRSCYKTYSFTQFCALCLTNKVPFCNDKNVFVYIRRYRQITRQYLMHTNVNFISYRFGLCFNEDVNFNNLSSFPNLTRGARRDVLELLTTGILP